MQSLGFNLKIYNEKSLLFTTVVFHLFPGGSNHLPKPSLVVLIVKRESFCYCSTVRLMNLLK